MGHKWDARMWKHFVNYKKPSVILLLSVSSLMKFSCGKDPLLSEPGWLSPAGVFPGRCPEGGPAGPCMGEAPMSQGSRQDHWPTKVLRSTAAGGRWQGWPCGMISSPGLGLRTSRWSLEGATQEAGCQIWRLQKEVQEGWTRGHKRTHLVTEMGKQPKCWIAQSPARNRQNINTQW